MQMCELCLTFCPLSWLGMVGAIFAVQLADPTAPFACAEVESFWDHGTTCSRSCCLLHSSGCFVCCLDLVLLHCSAYQQNCKLSRSSSVDWYIGGEKWGTHSFPKTHFPVPMNNYSHLRNISEHLGRRSVENRIVHRETSSPCLLRVLIAVKKLLQPVSKARSNL